MSVLGGWRINGSRGEEVGEKATAASVSGPEEASPGSPAGALGEVKEVFTRNGVRLH